MKPERMYVLTAVNEKTGKVYVLMTEPMTHKEACAVLSKMTAHPYRRLVLAEVAT